mgnify:CR=1 FL=1
MLRMISPLAEGAKLSMELVLQKGQGYVSSDRNKQLDGDKAPIGTIFVDSKARTDRSSSSMVISRTLSLPVSSFFSMISVEPTSSESSTKWLSCLLRILAARLTPKQD